MINPANVSCVLITKDPTYPKEIIEYITNFAFGEIHILTHSDSPHRKQELFQVARFDYIYYQDDDCIAPTRLLMEFAKPDIITCAMKEFHLDKYKNSRIALLGWGTIFPKETIKVLDRYRAVYGEDNVYKRETERIMTWFNYPQLRLELPIIDLPSAFADDRLSMQRDHYNFIPIVEERCLEIERG